MRGSVGRSARLTNSIVFIHFMQKLLSLNSVSQSFGLYRVHDVNAECEKARGSVAAIARVTACSKLLCCSSVESAAVTDALRAASSSAPNERKEGLASLKTCIQGSVYER